LKNFGATSNKTMAEQFIPKAGSVFSNPWGILIREASGLRPLQRRFRPDGEPSECWTIPVRANSGAEARAVQTLREIRSPGHHSIFGGTP
jgi:hypothetical protein